MEGTMILGGVHTESRVCRTGSRMINRLIRRALVMPPWAGFGRRSNAGLGTMPAHLDKEAVQVRDGARDQGGTG